MKLYVGVITLVDIILSVLLPCRIPNVLFLLLFQLLACIKWHFGFSEIFAPYYQNILETFTPRLLIIGEMRKFGLQNI